MVVKSSHCVMNLFRVMCDGLEKVNQGARVAALNKSSSNMAFLSTNPN